MSDPRVEAAFDTRHSLAECPVWDHRTDELVWVDLDAGRLWSARPGAGPRLLLDLDADLTAVALADDGTYLLAVDRDIVRFDPARPRPGSPRPLAAAGTRCNDGAVDAAGRLWMGTMDGDHRPGRGSLFRVTPDRVDEPISGVGVSNGIGWSPDNTRMYHVDTLTRTVDVYDFDLHTGSISERRTFASIDDAPGYPDGLAVDDRGNVWVALWDGGAIRCYDAGGNLAEHVGLPVSRPTSCTFGGADLATLYITTARGSLSPAARAAEPLAGAVLCLAGMGRGLPAHRATTGTVTDHDG